MAPRLIGWGVTALIGGAIWAVLAPLLRWVAFLIYWKIHDSDYRRDMPGAAFSERWQAARVDWADLAEGGLNGALSAFAAVLALRLVIVLRNKMREAGEKDAARRKSRPDRAFVEKHIDADLAARRAAGAKIFDRDSMVAEVERNLDQLHRTDDAGLAGAWKDGAAIERLFPPPATPGLSHLGGLPIAGPDVVWPRGPGGVPNFVAQIALADLPDFPTRALFPETGVLHFFLPSLQEGSFNRGGVGPLVAYTQGDGPTAEIAPPADLPPHGDGTTGRRGRWPLRLRQTAYPVARGAVYPYHPVTLRPVERDDRPERGPFPGLPDRIGADAQRGGRDEATRFRAGELIGPPRSDRNVAWVPPLDRVWRPDPGFPSDWLQIDVLACAAEAQLAGSLTAMIDILARGRDRGQVTMPGSQGPWPSLIPVLDANVARLRAEAAKHPETVIWQQMRADAELRLAIASGKTDPPHGDRVENWQAEVARHEAALAQVTDWLARTEQGVAEGSAPSPAETQAFWSLIRDIAEARIAACHWTIGPLACTVLRQTDRAVQHALTHAAEERLATGQAQPDALIAALAGRHTPGARVENGATHGRHRIGGAPDVVQEAAEFLIETHVLLLQLDHDDPMGFRFGDAGIFQWWIKPDDLAARRWDAVELVFEGH